VAESSTEPLVSVIVPVYEGERFLEAALASVSAQTYGHLETIVVDDGSSDRSAELAERRPGVRVLRQRNGGVAAARNAGLERARGELLAFLDQDDEWLPQRLAKQVEHLRAHPDLAIVRARMEVALQNGTPRPPWLEASRLTEPQPGYAPSTWLVRREAFELAGRFDTTFELACDSDWLARASDAGLQSAMLEEVLVRWRVHGANGSYEQAKMRLELLRMVRGSVMRRRQDSQGKGGETDR
jgi:glycosyltransferase involved in cell wall biosynthesis